MTSDILIVPLIGVIAAALYVFSEYALTWLSKHPGKVAAFLLMVAGLFLVIRFAPGLLNSARLFACGG